MTNKDELLSDEELVQQLKQVYRDGYYSNNNTDTDNFKAHLFWFKEYIDTQKRLYAESLAPKKVAHRRTGPGMCSCGFDAYKIDGIMLDYGEELRNHIRRAEQRSRNNA